MDKQICQIRKFIFYNVEQKDRDIILKPKKQHTHTLIWLHGLGDSAHGFYDVFDSPISPVTHTTKVILPTAPQRSVTINSGAVMNAWYDMLSLDRVGTKEEDNYSMSDIDNSNQIISKLLDQEVKELKDSKKVFIGGFSQGCAMSLYAAFNYQHALGGVFGLSGYLFSFSKLNNADKIPIRLMHGDLDDVIPMNFALSSYERLQLKCKNYKIHIEKGLPHSLNENQLNIFKNWYTDITTKQ